MYEIIKQISELGSDIEPTTSLLKEIITWGENEFVKRRNKTIENFYIQLLDGEVTQEKINYEKEHIKANSEQYYILLNLAINDEEQEKDFIYSNVYRYIRDNQQLDKKDKTRLIKIVKQLPYSAMELLPYIYIYANFLVKRISLKQLLRDMETTHEYELNLLSQFNILFKPTAFKSNINDIFEIKDANYFNNLCKAFFKEENLIPEKYGIEICIDKKVLIIVDNEFNESITGDRIKEILTTLSIQSEIIHYKSATAYGFTDALFLTDYVEVNSIFENLSNVLETQQNIRCIKVSMFSKVNNTDSNTIYLANELDKFKALFSE